MQDVITYANETNKSSALITVDQLKAFDRVSHILLFKTLEKFGFGPNFQQWIKTFYNNVASSVKVNGRLTAFIPIECSLPQGCALSTPLYVLTAELLATYLRDVRAPQSYVHCFRTLQWLTSGGNFIRPQGLLVGQGWMVLWPPILIFSVFPRHAYT